MTQKKAKSVGKQWDADRPLIDGIHGRKDRKDEPISPKPDTRSWDQKPKMIQVSSLRVNPDNPRTISKENVEKLKKSISELPKIMELRPIVADMASGGLVLGGNQRLQAILALGMTEVPESWVKDASGLNEDEKQKFIIADNASFGEWNWDMLANQWPEQLLVDFCIDVPGFEVTELESAKEDDYEIPDTIQTDIVLGDLIEIGEHRLFCGDSTDSDQVAKLMNGEKADMAHNDPPYGMKKENVGVLNDNLNYDDLLDFNREWIALQFSHLKENGSFYCWGTDEPLMDIYSHILKPYIKEQKATFRNLITWDKGHGQGQNSEKFRMYPIADEKCLFVMCGVQGFNNNADNYFEGLEIIRAYLENEAKKTGLTTSKLKDITGFNMYQHWFTKSQWQLIPKEQYLKLQDYFKNEYDAFKKEYDEIKKEYDEIKKEYDEIKKEYDEIKKEYYSTRAYFYNTHDNQNNVWRFERTSNKEREITGGHATPKPILLCERTIKSSCPENGLVIDFFLGSGSTMVACHQLNRKCFGMELDPNFCQVIVDRMLKLDPQIPIKINGDVYKKTEQQK